MVLADDMGLGKTVQALTLLLSEHKKPGPASLVVAPTSVIYAWKEEAERFTPELKVSVFHGESAVSAPEDADVIVTYMDYFATRKPLDRPWRVMFLDEAQRITSTEPRSPCRSPLNAQYRYALTGTWKIAYSSSGVFLMSMPGFFGPRQAFRRSPCRLSVTAMNKRSCASSGGSAPLFYGG